MGFVSPVGLLFVFNYIYLLGCVGLCCDTQDLLLWRPDSLVMAHGLSCSEACGILVSQLAMGPGFPASQGGFLSIKEVPPGARGRALGEVILKSLQPQSKGNLDKRDKKEVCLPSLEAHRCF